MTFESAFSSVQSGGTSTNAMKRPSWLGYVSRADVPCAVPASADYSAWASATAYAVGAKVSNGGNYYICTVPTSGDSAFPTAKFHQMPTSVRYATWMASTPYAVGAKVTSDSSYYICKTAHTSGTTFSATNWIEVDRDGFVITFRERQDDATASDDNPFDGIGDDGQTNYEFEFSPYVNGTSIDYSCSKASGETSGVKALEVDAKLMDSLLASDWATGKASDYETARSGSGGGRW